MAAFQRGDYATALDLLKPLAEQGNADAQNHLGVAYNVDLNMWLNLAASQGDKLAAEKRDAVAKLMTPDQIAEAQRRALEWKPTTAR